MKKLFAIIVVIAILLCLSSCSNKNTEESSSTNETTESITPSETTSDGVHFESVSNLLSSIKYDPYNYIDKDIQVCGTLCKFESNTLLFDRPPTSSSGSNTGSLSAGVAFRSEAKTSPNIEIIIPDEILYTVIEDGDYITVSGTVKISDGKIYLDNCTYTFSS